MVHAPNGTHARIFSLVTILKLQFTIFYQTRCLIHFFITITSLVAFLTIITELPFWWVKYGFGRFDQIRVLPRVKYGFVTVDGQIENRVKYGFVTVRNLLLVRAIRGVRGIRKLP
jgi:hypothetical protein